MQVFAGNDRELNVMVLTTGGTIEKRYDELEGALRNEESPLNQILSRLRLPSVRIKHKGVMQKDSLDMTDQDRRAIASAVADVPEEYEAVLIIHGTDTLAQTGDMLCELLGDLVRPVVLTGSMRPFEFADTDAYQNVVEALLACRLLSPGVYVAMHSKVLRFPGVRKDRGLRTFVRDQVSL